MFITLTNASPAFKGKQLTINSDIIATINSGTIDRQIDEETTVSEEVTFIFCPPHGTWEVSESLEEVTDKLNGKSGFLK